MKRWIGFTGHYDAQEVATTKISFEVVNRFTGEVAGVFETRAEAETFRVNTYGFGGGWLTRQVNVPEALITRVQYLIPLFPPIVFSEAVTILATRGFWDVTITARQGTTPIRTVSNFAMGMTVQPRRVLFDEGEEEGMEFIDYIEPDDNAVPNLLTDDIGWFVYESFARVTESAQINHDPPFYSKSKRRVPANSGVAMYVDVDLDAFQTANITATSFTFGCRGRMLIAI